MATTVLSPNRPTRIWRSVGAVVAGFLTIAILDNAIDFGLHSTGVYPPFGQPMADHLFLLALAYRALDGILGSYIVGRLAPSRPVAHAMTLGGIGVVLSSLGVLAVVSGDAMFGPLWYPLTLTAIVLPTAYLGGRLAQSHRR